MAKRFFGCERGTNVIELALMLPFLLMLVLGVLDIGRGFSTYIALTNAAREGARWLTIYPDDVDGAYGRIYAEAGRVGVENDELVVGLDPLKSRYGAGDEVTVDIRYDHELFFGALDASAIPFTVRVTMVVLYD